MAKQQNGYLGGYSGRLGPVVGYLWRGKWCLRVKPGKVHNPRTDRQQSHRHLFKAMVQFASRQSQVLRIGMRQVSHDEGMTEQNLFVSLNSQSFSLVDGALEVDYSRLLFSCGPVAPVAFGKPAVDDRRVLTVSSSATRCTCAPRARTPSTSMPTAPRRNAGSCRHPSTAARSR